MKNMHVENHTMQVRERNFSKLIRTFFTLFSPFLSFLKLFSAQDFSIVTEFVVT